MNALSDINKDAEKQEQLLKELEIENILAETHEMADREKMKRTAQKYRVKPKVADIFSNADMKPRLTNANPLDLDKEEESNNTIVGDKNAATMQAELPLLPNTPRTRVFRARCSVPPTPLRKVPLLKISLR